MYSVRKQLDNVRGNNGIELNNVEELAPALNGTKKSFSLKELPNINMYSLIRQLAGRMSLDITYLLYKAAL